MNVGKGELIIVSDAWKLIGELEKFDPVGVGGY